MSKPLRVGVEATDAPRRLASIAADRGQLETGSASLRLGQRCAEEKWQTCRVATPPACDPRGSRLDTRRGVPPAKPCFLGGAVAVLNAAFRKVFESVSAERQTGPQDEAACSLLRNSVGYPCDAADTTVAPYDFSHVALPPDARASPYVVDLLGAEDCQLLEVGKRRCCAQLVSARSSTRSSARQCLFLGTASYVTQDEVPQNPRMPRAPVAEPPLLRRFFFCGTEWPDRVWKHGGFLRICLSLAPPHQIPRKPRLLRVQRVPL